MKFLFILFIHLLASYSYAQSYETKYNVVAIQENQSIQLDSRGKLGGKDRNYIKFRLPPNTVKWYYVFGTYTPEERPPAMELAIELGNLVGQFSKKVKVATVIIDKITEPDGNSAIDLYLTNKTGHDEFFEENLTGWAYISPSHLEDGTRESIKSGKIGVDKIYSGDLYLNFKNPRMMGGITVNVSIAAIVAERTYVDEWTSENKNLVYEKCLTGFQTQSSEIKDICNCITEKFAYTYKPQYFKSLSVNRQTQTLNSIKKECYQTTGNQELEEKHKKIEALLKEIQGLNIVKDYANLADRYKQLIELGRTTANVYNSAAWNLLLTKEFEKAKEFIIKGLGENPNNLYLQGNLANYFLLTGAYSDAEEIYLKFKTQSISSTLTWKKAVAQDLELFEELGIYNQDFERVRQALGIVKRETAQKIEAVKKEIIGLEITKDYPGLVNKYDRLIQLGLKNAYVYNSAGWYSLLNRQFEEAKAYILKGLGEDRENPTLYGNLASYYLLTGEFEKAKEIHQKFKKYKFDKKTTWKNIVAEDLNLFEKLDIYHKDFNRVRKFLGIPRGRHPETFDPRYGTGGTMTFSIGKESFIGVVKELDKEKGNLKIDYLNIYGEPSLVTRKVTNASPLSLVEYKEQLAKWEAEIQKYKYTIGQCATWLQQKELQFGRIVKLDDKAHKASIEYLNIYGETKSKAVPYLEVNIIEANEYETKLNAWNVEVDKFKFTVGELVSWKGKGDEMIEGEVVSLDDKAHQAEVKFINEKGEEKVVKRGYLKLVKKV